MNPGGSKRSRREAASFAPGTVTYLNRLDWPTAEGVAGPAWIPAFRQGLHAAGLRHASPGPELPGQSLRQPRKPLAAHRRLPPAPEAPCVEGLLSGSRRQQNGGRRDIGFTWPFSRLPLHPSVFAYLQQNGVSPLIHKEIEENLQRFYPDLEAQWEDAKRSRIALRKEMMRREEERKRAERYAREAHSQPVLVHLVPRVNVGEVRVRSRRSSIPSSSSTAIWAWPRTTTPSNP